MAEWISVKDRLPEDDLPRSRKVVKVLTCSSKGMIRTETRIKGKYWGNEAWQWGKGHDVTHWMPLPEPPKEDA